MNGGLGCARLKVDPLKQSHPSQLYEEEQNHCIQPKARQQKLGTREKTKPETGHADLNGFFV